MRPFNSDANPRKDLYQEITDKVIEALEKGTAIWRQSWSAKANQPKAFFPMNLSTGRYYKGWNHFYLEWLTKLQNFSTPYFLTFKQAQAMGGRIKKGSKGFQIVKWIQKDDQAKSPNPQPDDPVHSPRRPKLIPARSIVFNADQTEGIELPVISGEEPKTAGRMIACEQIVSGMPNPPRIEEGGAGAAYSRTADLIRIPPIAHFEPTEEYYSTLFHEMIHSTGHPNRLARKELIENDGLAGVNYSKEELTAEMGAAYLCGVAGIQQKTLENSAAYIGGWLEALRNDKTMILSAAAKAQAAADFILNESPEASETESHHKD